MEKIKLPKVKNVELGEAYNKIMQWFFAYPLLPITLTELAKETKVSKKTATVVVVELVNRDFLIKEEVGRAWRIYCNQKHPYNSSKKVAYNLSMIYQLLNEGGLIKNIYSEVGNAKAIVLFGSYRKGDDTEKSDIDIAVEIAGLEPQRIINIGNLPKLGWRNNVAVNLHVFSKKNIDPNLFSNILNGIVLEGFLDL